MTTSSQIQRWSEKVWNPVTGCTPHSMGCAHCYAKGYSLKLHGMGMAKYAKGFDLTLHEHLLEDPLHIKKPSMIFVNSMSDLFHEGVPTEFILKAFDTMHKAHWHQFQVLTKRSERLVELNPILPWAKNIWMGVTVEHKDFLYRVDHLRATGASLKFLSIEPLLSALHDLTLEGIDWAIVGGESGLGARFMEEAWVTEIRDKCLAAKVPFFFKQWGGIHRKKNGCLLQGREWKEMPE